jgi:pyruvate,water dikinase
VVYLNVVTPLLANLYSRIFEKQLANLGIDFLRFDLFEDMGELDKYNPNEYLQKLNHIYNTLNPIEKDTVQSSLSNTGQSGKGNTRFQTAFNEFINRFGHISTNSNNFTAIPWREDPQSILNMIREFKAGDRDMENRIGFDDLRINPLKKPVYRFFYRRARQFNLFQEEVSSKYIYGYGLFRPYFLQLAEEFVKLGWLENKNDIFYLTWEEIKQAISMKDASGFSEKIMTRQEKMRQYQDVILPEVIYGDDPPPVFSESHERLQGTPTSQGYYAGPIKIVKGIGDFEKVVSGDVIVIPYSDVGWTPLFNRAGAVIAESGGLLSHSSIIAREYQIPAVVSVRNCMVLRDHQQVSVNGFTGEIVLLEDETGK